MKSMFKKVDNGYKTKFSYICIINGLVIEPGDGWLDIYKWYVGDKGFNYLADAKNFCLQQNNS